MPALPGPGSGGPARSRASSNTATPPLARLHVSPCPPAVRDHPGRRDLFGFAWIGYRRSHASSESVAAAQFGAAR
jgi:hypothetical protein